MSDTPDLLGLAQTALAKWQPRLHLRDYQIKVVIGALDDDSSALGSVRMGHTEKHAVIYIPPDFVARISHEDEAFCHPTEIADQVEKIVLHELLHVKEQPYHSRLKSDITYFVGDDAVVGTDIRTAYTYYRENWINAMCRTLMEADRGGWST